MEFDVFQPVTPESFYRDKRQEVSAAIRQAQRDDGKAWAFSYVGCDPDMLSSQKELAVYAMVRPEEKAAQRFFRVDPSRQRGGHGLGLSLAREIVRAHGGDIILAPEREAGWNEFILTLPRCVS